MHEFQMFTMHVMHVRVVYFHQNFCTNKKLLQMKLLTKVEC